VTAILISRRGHKQADKSARVPVENPLGPESEGIFVILSNFTTSVGPWFAYALVQALRAEWLVRCHRRETDFDNRVQRPCKSNLRMSRMRLGVQYGKEYLGQAIRVYSLNGSNDSYLYSSSTYSSRTRSR
jgi:hypothetical protein